MTANLPARLKVLRRVICMSQDRFAASLDIDQTAVSAFENGDRIPGLAVAIRMCNKHKITLDWLYRGIPDGLPIHMQLIARPFTETTAADSSIGHGQVMPTP